MKILFFSTHQQACGIADYTQHFADALTALGHEVSFFDSPTSLLGTNPSTYTEAMQRLRSLAETHDVLHVQHEFGLFKAWQVRLLGEKVFKRPRNFKVIVTLHTTPKPVEPMAQGLMARILRRGPEDEVRAQLAALVDSDRILVHSAFGRNQLKKFQLFNPKHIKVIAHPIPMLREDPPATAAWHLAAQQLALVPGDHVFVVPGFLFPSKGQHTAVKAFSLLPPHFKLILAGGVHPAIGNFRDLDAVADEIHARSLQSRVHYTGYLSEADLNSVMFHAHAVLLPYDHTNQASSGVLGLGLRFGKQIVATRTRPFMEMAETMPGIHLCASFAYADIAAQVRATAAMLPGDPEPITKAARSISYPSVTRKILKQYYARKSSPPSQASLTATPLQALTALPSNLQQHVLAQWEAVPEGWCWREKALKLAELIWTARPLRTVEVGLFGGKSFIPMAAVVAYLESEIAHDTPTYRIEGFDPWSAAIAIEDHDGTDQAESWNNQAGLEHARETCLIRCNALHTKSITIHRETSEQAAQRYEDGSIGVISVDGNHAETQALADVQRWWPKLIPYGVLIMDDTAWETQAKAVAWLRERGQVLWEWQEGTNSCIFFVKLRA